MDAKDKRDLMAAMIVQKLVNDKLIWLGEAKVKNETSKVEEVYTKDGFQTIVEGAYVLVDKMLAQGGK
ncbi:MAG: hypothetical protein C0507_13735 [Cyanobacteria bacterium PR.3.49]|nr:hypothetical protein [Cyanobacteria bacterium PR.3.49]